MLLWMYFFACIALAASIGYGSAYKAAQMLVDISWRRPLHTLYMHAPAFMQFGGWAGATLSDVCAAVTSMPSDFWALHPAECESMVSRRFDSWRRSLEAVAHLTLLAWIVVKGVIAFVANVTSALLALLIRKLQHATQIQTVHAD